MTKHQWLAYTAGIWCFFVTAICCLMGIYSTDPMTLLLNILTPIVLTALGLILPAIKKHEDAKIGQINIFRNKKAQLTKNRS